MPPSGLHATGTCVILAVWKLYWAHAGPANDWRQLPQGGCPHVAGVGATTATRKLSAPLAVQSGKAARTKSGVRHFLLRADQYSGRSLKDAPSPYCRPPPTFPTLTGNEQITGSGDASGAYYFRDPEAGHGPISLERQSHPPNMVSCRECPHLFSLTRHFAARR
ncbi:hypothetical protein HYQ45_014545 [Verticillium longisporum]|uniref:C2H2-type domain-containing protein n=1 Tax=Verticillium longisporum TaxID=100787 RepID=A0A8I3ALM8_VERLO|nr:hypothetical protein HYQ45_014545 [Verticillium longisporum]